MCDSLMEGDSFQHVFSGDPPVVHVVSQIFWVSLEQFSEVSVHHSLEERWHVHQAKIHDLRDESSILCFEHRFVLVLLCNSDIIISPLYVELREEGFISQILKRFPDIRERVVIPDCLFVDLSVVHDNTLFF